MAKVKDIPQTLVYEMVNGKPIYYHGYQDVLAGKKQLEEVMGSSILQAFIVTQIVAILIRGLDPQKFFLFTNELGLLFGPKSWRSLDIAVYDRKTLENVPFNNQYINKPPKVVIEIDTKANLDDNQPFSSYFQAKTDQLLDFGTEKVIWIFTENQKVMIAEAGKDWITSDWSKEIELLEGVKANLAEIVKNAPMTEE